MTLTMTALTAFTDGAKLALDLSGTATFDRLVTNGITLDGVVNLEITRTFAPAEGTQFLVVDNTSANPISGTPGLLPPMARKAS